MKKEKKIKIKKKRKKHQNEKQFLFFKIFIVTLIILLANIGIIFYHYFDANKGLTGFAITDIKNNPKDIFVEMSFPSKLFLFMQGGALAVLLSYVFSRDKKLSRLNNEVKKIVIKKDPYKTDLDILYNELKKNKQMKISAIAKAFNITKDTANEWGKILESGDLATIEYPGFGEPSIKIKEKVEENPNELKIETNQKEKIEISDDKVKSNKIKTSISKKEKRSLKNKHINNKKINKKKKN